MYIGGTQIRTLYAIFAFLVGFVARNEVIQIKYITECDRERLFVVGAMPGALAGATKLAAIEEVVIDSTGRFKYILCKVYEQGTNPATGAVKNVVRGTARVEFHCEPFHMF